MKLVELGSALEHHLSEIEHDIIKSEYLRDKFDQMSISMDELVDSSPEWNRHENEQYEAMLCTAHMWDCLGWWNYVAHDYKKMYEECLKENPSLRISITDWMLLAYQDAVAQGDIDAVHRLSNHLYYVEDIDVPYDPSVTV